MKKKKIILMTICVLVTSVILLYNPRNAFIKEEVEEHKELNRSTFAIYKELTEGGSDWTLSDDTKFPDKGYILNTTRTECHGYNDEVIPGVLTQNDDMSITISSNKTIYCNIYFDKDDTAPVVSKFNIIGKDSKNQELRNGYTYEYGVTYEIGWLDEDVKEYCISSNISNCDGEWIKSNGLTNITTDAIDLPDEEGLKTMYLFIKDKANNISNITDTSTKQITVDQTPPVVKALTLTGKDSGDNNLNNGFTYNTTISYKAEWDNNDVAYICVNNVSECSNYELTNGANEKGGSIGLQEGEGKKTVYAYIADKANNWSMVKSTDITVDRTLPVINTFTIVGKGVSGVTLTDSNLYSHTVNVGYTFNWTEENPSVYCITSGNECGSNEWVEASGTGVSNAVKALTTGDGNKTMKAYVIDKAGNISLVASDSIMLDLTAPTVTIAKSSVTTSSITVTLGGSDGSGSGIDSYQCRISSINNGTWKNAILVGGKYQCTVGGLQDNTPYTVEGRTIDASGRISDTQTVSDTTEKKTTTALDLTKAENRPSGLSENLLGDMYRFVGTKETVNNYVCFGYSNATTDCKEGETSDYMYRIIGITQNGQFKLIKNTAIRESGSSDEGRYRWWKNYTTDISWPQSNIFLRLNGKGTDNTTGFSGNTNLFIDSETSNVTYIKSSGDTTWYSKIENHKWKYGDVRTGDASANAMYERENGFETSIQAEIGLMNISDYYYSYADNGTDSSSTNCSGSSKCGGSWLNITNNGKSSDYYFERTMVRMGWSVSSYSGYYIWWQGGMVIDSLNSMNSIRPVFFLTPEASQIEDEGKGTASEPFIIVK